MVCVECGVEMELVDTASGTQADGCDVDIDTYRCPICGEYDSE
jgi:hypothetical protein